jgi:hypothetical protein
LVCDTTVCGRYRSEEGCA